MSDSDQQPIDVSSLTKGTLDTETGRRVLQQWAEREEWFPDGFPAKATIESAARRTCERRIEREVVVEEHTENRELAPEEYEDRRSWLRDQDAYRNRGDDVVGDDSWEGEQKWADGTIEYEVPDTHRRSNCTECQGSGAVPCPECDSAGEIDCPECDGTGSVEVSADCPRCGGSGQTNAASDEQCDRCGGTGMDDVEEPCGNCDGTGTVTCPTCSGDGDVVCPVCDGEGITDKLDVLVRECSYRETVTHRTDGVPEQFIEDADGRYVRTEDAPTDETRPRHEIEVREIDVAAVEYTYPLQSLLGTGRERNSYAVYYVEGAFQHESYPQSRTRRLLPIAVAVLAVVLIIIGAVVVLM